jgi:serine kinase of HPr protein (carbohydrate metabolism regulator)
VAAEADRIHATAIAVGQHGVVFRGASGAGKSDLALRCLAHANGPFALEPVRLVADDQVHLVRSELGIALRAPDSLKGLLEVRGLGPVALPAHMIADGAQERIYLRLIVDLVTPEAVERLPLQPLTETILGCRVPRLRLGAFQVSSATKVLIALQQACRQ